MGTKAGEIKRFKLDEIEIPLVWCPAGRFKMGSPESEPQRSSDENQVDVEITKGFWLGQTPVTQQLYEYVMQENPSHFQGHPQRPVEKVDWTMSTRFCNQLSELLRGRDQLPQGVQFSLPTEAHWEYACRAGTKTAYSFGHLVSHLSQYGWFDGNAAGETHEVGQKQPNPWGLYDMHGNIWEWCSDWYVGTLSGGQDPWVPSSGSDRVNRGGSWNDYASDCRSAYRSRYSPVSRGSNLGFRLALVPSGS
jgi:formylglycine-generating enzyme required for sulfatase activity